MAINLNSWTATGRIGRDVEIRDTNSGGKVANIVLAVSDKDSTFWAKCVAFNKTAETISQYVSKGDELTIQARWVQREWTDQEGNKKTSQEAIIERFFFGRKKGESNKDIMSGQQEQREQLAPRQEPQRQAPQRHPEPEPAWDDSDVPF